MRLVAAYPSLHSLDPIGGPARSLLCLCLSSRTPLMSPSIHGRILCGQHMCHRVMLPHSSCGQWPPVLATVVPRRFACLYNPSACHLLPPIVASVRACGRLHPPAASLGPASPLTVASSGPLPVSYGLASLPLLVA